MSEAHDEREPFALKAIVTRDERRISSIKIDLGEKEEVLENREAPKDPNNKNSGKPETKPEKEKFTRHSCSPDELSTRLRQISNTWTTLSISFFEIVPELARLSFNHAKDEMYSEIGTYIEENSVKSIALEGEESSLEVFEHTIEEPHTFILLKKMGKSTRAVRAASVMNQASLGALIAEYEAFLSNLLRTIAFYQPTAFISDEYKISVKELETYGSFEEFLRDAIDQAIADLIQERSHLAMLKWIEAKFGVKLTSDKEMTAEFVEVCQRRHIISHAGGRVNKKYLNNCIEAGLTNETLPEIGEALVVDRKYLRRATARVYQVGLFTLHMLWQKLHPSDIRASHGELLGYSHDFLDSGLTKMARRVIKFALFSEKSMEGAVRASFVINEALSYLHDPSLSEDVKEEKISKLLDRQDWSMAPPLHRLALACVRRDFNNIDKLTQAAKDDGLNFIEAMTWVVFREARDLPEFRKHFEGGAVDIA